MPVMSQRTATLVLGFLASYSQAFQLTFWEGPQCTSAEQQSVNHAYTDWNRCYQVPTNSQSVTVQADGGDAPAENVAFYQSGDCSGDSVASSNTGCLSLIVGGDARSYLIANDNGPERRNDRPVNPWTPAQDAARAALKLAPDAQHSGSLSPEWDPYAPAKAGVGHGNVTERWGQTWKWQQVALGVNIGIPIDEWDDAIHKSSDEFVAFGEGIPDDAGPADTAATGFSPAGSTLQVRAELHKRWNYAQCQAMVQCLRNFANEAGVNLGNGWRAGVQAAFKAKQVGQTFYDFTHRHPFSVGIVTAGTSTAAGFALGYTKGGATAQDNNQLEQCAAPSNTSNQVEAFVQAFLTAAEGNVSAGNAAQIAIVLPDGNTLSISGEVYAKGQPIPAKAPCNASGS